MNEFQIAVLASGSKGNATLISNGKQQFLVDIGISCRSLMTRMRTLGISPTDLDGIFLTHEHIDHVRGLETFLKKYSTPVFSSSKTWQAILAKYNIDRRQCRIVNKNLQIGDISIDSFPIPHDAADPHGYIFHDLTNLSKCTYLTDTGFITDIVRQAVIDSNTLVLEANHDVGMLKNGNYPYHLKQRILSTRGHLSNDSAGLFLSDLAKLPKTIMLAHLSEQNNTEKLALDTVKNFLDNKGRLHETELFIAKQNEIVTNF